MNSTMMSTTDLFMEDYLMKTLNLTRFWEISSLTYLYENWYIAFFIYVFA